MIRKVTACQAYPQRSICQALETHGDLAPCPIRKGTDPWVRRPWLESCRWAAG